MLCCDFAYPSLRQSLSIINRIFIQRPHHSSITKLFSTSNVHHVSTCNRKIAAFARVGNIQAARQLFDQMPERDVVSWNSIITAYWKNGFFDESKRLFHSMPLTGIVSWNVLIAGFVYHDQIDEAFRYFKAMPQRNTASWNAMISGFVKQGRLTEAVSLFESMPKRNVISYTAMIDGYMKYGMVEEAKTLFESMPLKNAVSWTVMIRGYVENKRFDEAKVLYEQMPDKNVTVMTAMITGYFKEGKVDNARLLFEDIRCKDCVAWNAMIAGYAENGDGEGALKLYREMLKLGMQPNQSTFLSIFPACSALASLKEGRQTQAHVVKNGFDSNVPVCNAMITMYCKCGGILDSEAVFEQIQTPTPITWNTIIAAFSQHGFYDKAIAIFNRMCINGCQPNGITFLSLLSACGHAGKVTESMNLFDMMVKKYGIDPEREHYACLVDTLSRAGQLEKAYKIIKAMPYDADAGVWGSLLTACNIFRNVKMGELVAKKIVDLDPMQTGAYVMLSNIYASAGRWEDVKRVRLLMKERGLKKQSACSWVEIANKVHSFLGGDTSHPDIGRIRLELKCLSLEMKAITDTTELLLFCTFSD